MKKPKAKKRPRGGASVPCPRCQGHTRVVETRRTDQAVKRTRRCLRCQKVFVSEEAAVGAT